MKILRIWHFHPFLLATYPLLALYVWNFGRLDFLEFIRPLIIILAMVTLSVLLFMRLRQSLARAAIYISISSVLFFSYGHLVRVLPNIFGWSTALFLSFAITGLWIAIWIIGLWILFRFKKHHESITVYLNVVSLILIGSLLLELGVRDLANINQKQTALNSRMSFQDTKNNTELYRPDIYYIILDSYTRKDVFQDTFLYDNADFVSGLEEMGFIVGDESYSNYGQTALSVSSSLNFDYLRAIPIQSDTTQLDYRPYRKLILHNRVMDFLKQQGYEIITIESGYAITEVCNSDLYVQFSPSINNVEIALLESSFSVLFIQDWLREIVRDRIRKSFWSIPEIALRPSPKFVFLHVLALHDPFVFDQTGAPLDKNVPEFDGYRTQVGYINQLTLETVRLILHNSKTDPVIILQGDHGPSVYGQTSVSGENYLHDRFAILNAMYLPENNRGSFYETISPVNTFRLIFNTFFNTKLPYLNDESYFSIEKPSYSFVCNSNDVLQCSPSEENHDAQR